MPGRNTHNRAGRILDAAANLITHYGYAKTTVDDIARAAGVAKGAIYLHWPGKDELLAALLARELLRMLDDTVARVSADPQGGTLPRLYIHALLALRANPVMCALYTQDSRVLGDFMQRQAPGRYTQRFLFGQTFLEGLQAAGLVRPDLPPAALAYVLSIIAYGFATIETIIPAAEAPPLEQVGEVLAGLMAHGAALEGGDSAAGQAAMLALVEAVRRQISAVSQ